MNKRLILFFELLKQMGVRLGEINMTLDRNNIEDWNESILYGVKGQRQTRKLPNFLVKVIKDLLDEYEYKFNRYNNYDIDEYWYLTILINTEVKEINFQSSCKQEKENDFEKKSFVPKFPDLSEMCNASPLQKSELAQVHGTPGSI